MSTPAKTLEDVAVSGTSDQPQTAQGGEKTPRISIARQTTAAKRRSVPKWLPNAAKRVLPPLLTVGLLLGIWEITCSSPGASLPAPSTVVRDSWELLAH